MRDDIRLGRLMRMICAGAEWESEDEFPAWQCWADECEQILTFLESQGQFGRFLPRLRGRAKERTCAMSEARVAWWFHRNGFRINQWEPRATTKPGEIEIVWADQPPIFVEVKTRTFGAELTKEEIAAGRQHQPRYEEQPKGRWIDNDEQVICAANKASPKFAADRPNLLVVAEHLFVSPIDLSDPEFIQASINKPGFDPLGAILCFDAVSRGEVIEYRTVFIENPRAAGKPWQIPEPVAEGLRAGNHTRGGLF